MFVMPHCRGTDLGGLMRNTLHTPLAVASGCRSEGRCYIPPTSVNTQPATAQVNPVDPSGNRSHRPGIVSMSQGSILPQPQAITALPSGPRVPRAAPPLSTRGERPDMLDAYIIDRIRRDRESRERQQGKRHQIEMPRPGQRPPYDHREEKARRERSDEPKAERGVVIIDFTI